MLAADHWAGFWEQWLLRLARDRWPDAFLEVDTELQLLWYSLPLVGPVKKTQNPHRRWQRAIEKPLKALALFSPDSLFPFRSQPRGRLRHEPLHPGWRTQIPVAMRTSLGLTAGTDINPKPGPQGGDRHVFP